MHQIWCDQSEQDVWVWVLKFHVGDCFLILQYDVLALEGVHALMSLDALWNFDRWNSAKERIAAYQHLERGHEIVDIGKRCADDRTSIEQVPFGIFEKI
jgi:hypothetical protein